MPGARFITIEQYLRLLRAKGPQHTKAVLIFAMNTGMGSGDLRGLKSGYIDRATGFIRLPAEIVKEEREKKSRSTIMFRGSWIPSLGGMDTHYLKPSEERLKEAMDRYTRWLDAEIEKVSANLDQSLDQKAKNENG